MDSKWSCLLVLVGFSVGSVGCRLAEREMQDRTPQGCANCHTIIAQQWESSAHARAWNDPEFVERTRDYSVPNCLPCHASRPLLEQPPHAPPELRDHDRHHGIDCTVCHRLGEAYVGRYRNHVGPHPTVQDTTRLPCSDFCGTCHEAEHREYVELYLASVEVCAERTCGNCHMPTCRTRLTQGHLLSLIHPKRDTHDHSFPTWTPEVSAGAVTVGQPSAIRGPNGQLEIDLTLTNEGAGHCIPTGVHGYRELRVEVELLASDGSSMARAEQSLFPGRARSLRPGVATPLDFEVLLPPTAQPDRVRVLVERVNRDRTFRFTLAEGEWPLAARAAGPGDELPNGIR